MSTEVTITLNVNGERMTRRVEARRHLVDFLRLDLGLMGAHGGRFEAGRPKVLHQVFEERRIGDPDLELDDRRARRW